MQNYINILRFLNQHADTGEFYNVNHCVPDLSESGRWEIITELIKKGYVYKDPRTGRAPRPGRKNITGELSDFQSIVNAIKSQRGTWIDFKLRITLSGIDYLNSINDKKIRIQDQHLQTELIDLLRRTIDATTQNTEFNTQNLLLLANLMDQVNRGEVSESLIEKFLKTGDQGASIGAFAIALGELISKVK